MSNELNRSAPCVLWREGARLIAREPHLTEAAHLEAALAVAYARMAALESDGKRADQLREIALLTRKFGHLLEDLVHMGGVKHHPKPTRVRLSLFKRRALATLQRKVGAALVKKLDGHGSTDGATRLATQLGKLEYDAILKPLMGITRITPNSTLHKTLQGIFSRHHRLRSPGAEAATPTQAGRPIRRGTANGSRHRRKRGVRTCLMGTVERLNPNRRCGAVRGEDGSLVVFSYRVVEAGEGLQVGDRVSATVRGGPLGLSATTITVMVAEPA